MGAGPLAYPITRGLQSKLLTAPHYVVITIISITVIALIASTVSASIVLMHQLLQGFAVGWRA